MKRKDFFEFLYEKVVVAAMITALSAYLLYSYNIYSKAFETAQAQSKGYSTLALRLRDLVLGGTIKVGQNIRVAYVKPTRTLPKDISDSADDISVEMKQIADLLDKRAPLTAAAAKKAANQLKNAVSAFQSEVNFNKVRIDGFETEIAKLRLDFVEIFNTELNKINFEEFRNFLVQFEDQIPWWQRPLTAVEIALGLFLAFTVGLYHFSQKSKTSKSKPSPAHKTKKTAAR